MAPSARPTLHDVAARAGVSARTVSRVVNREAVVAQPTLDVVNDAIRELGYRPNKLARGLINQRSGMIALMVTSMSNPFFSELADGVRAAAAELDLSLVLTSSEDDAEAQRRLLDDLQSHAVEGVICFCAWGGRSSIIDAAAHGTPVVILNDVVRSSEVVSVRADLEDGARQAVAHLVERGHHRLGMIAGELDADHSRMRESGFLSACASLGISDPVVVHEPHTVDGGAQGLAKLLSAQPEISGVFAFNDLMAIGAVRAAPELGRSVPETLGVVGFDDVAMAALFTPPITTIRNDGRALGRLAVDTLASIIRSENVEVQPAKLGVELVVRGSA